MRIRAVLVFGLPFVCCGWPPPPRVRPRICMHRLFSGCVAALLASAPICLSAQAPTSIEELLALPPSPGVEVLLLPHAADPRVPLRWRQGVVDPDPSRRAAAARMLGIAGVRTAVGTLSAASAKEEDVVARGEMLRALVVVGSDVTNRNVLRRVNQLSGLKADQVVRTLATVRPASVTAFLLGGGDLSDVRARASARAGRASATSEGSACRGGAPRGTARPPGAGCAAGHPAHDPFHRPSSSRRW